MRIFARATVTVEFSVTGENWTEHTTLEQVNREASALALAHLDRLCQRHVVIVGKPKIEAIIIMGDKK